MLVTQARGEPFGRADDGVGANRAEISLDASGLDRSSCRLLEDPHTRPFHRFGKARGELRRVDACAVRMPVLTRRCSGRTI